MAIYLVRHAKAGSRSEWDGDDRKRPLSRAGQRQAEVLGRNLARLASGPLVSSPYLRCVQTLEPLAHFRQAPIGTDDRLAEEQSFEGALELIASLPDGAALCSHGDVIPATIAALERRGAEFIGRADFRKASVWVLERDEMNVVVSGTCWSPPGADPVD